MTPTSISLGSILSILPAFVMFFVLPGPDWVLVLFVLAAGWASIVGFLYGQRSGFGSRSSPSDSVTGGEG